MILNRHGGSRHAPQGRVDHRMSPLKDVEEEENPPSSRLAHYLDPHTMNRAIVELREDLEHERYRIYALTDSVRRQIKDREVDRAQNRADYALAELQVERDARSLVEDLGTYRRDISHLNG